MVRNKHNTPILNTLPSAALSVEPLSVDAALPVLPVSADDPHPANVPTANAAAKNILTAFFIIILLVCEANPILRSKIFPLSEERI